ncbi:hypothetical protein RRG08_001097 [Elysia crispata]|uniref:Uncharacterized protein n=1 Tax=Elysia crispata TaxID=231223 RepID=A0AAE1AXA9_9GAST|nr:hypothetical protein RRG08_001097 [Elysia crispata]
MEVMMTQILSAVDGGGSDEHDEDDDALGYYRNLNKCSGGCSSRLCMSEKREDMMGRQNARPNKQFREDFTSKEEERGRVGHDQDNLILVIVAPTGQGKDNSGHTCFTAGLHTKEQKSVEDKDEERPEN